MDHYLSKYVTVDNRKSRCWSYYIYKISGLLLPIPFAIRIDNIMNDNSSIIALMIKFGLPNGIPMRPIKIIENKIINTWFFGFKISISSYTTS